MTKLFIRAMVGIGDNLYARPFIKDLALHHQVSLMTGFPQLFGDIRGIRLVRAQTSLPYVKKNIRDWGVDNDWRGAPREKPDDEHQMEPVFMAYDPNDPANVTEQIERAFPIRHLYQFDLPPPDFRGINSYLTTLFQTRKKYVVIRPVVVREGFGTSARNCKAKYVHEAVETLKSHGILTISVARIGDGETGEAPLPECDISYMDGVLSFPEMIELVRHSAGVVSGPGFAMPMAVAAKRPLLAIWGARGRLDNPERIFDRRMDLSQVVNSIPDNFCRHSTGECACDKTISRFGSDLMKFVNKVHHALPV
jgi:ADP-heptose:LPS heptosyltransferase